ncbi:MAG: EamA family transporter [Chlorobi bacterium]|nr:EamA family transporter [Chlorobiota bacterium]
MAGIKKNIVLAHLAVIGANIIYGINYVVAKGIMPDYFPPRVAIIFRVVGATAIFWLVGIFFPKVHISKKDYLRLAVCGFFGIALNQIMFFEGLNLTTPINASIIMVGIPILVLIFAHFILKEGITKNKVFGILLGMGGAIYLILRGSGGSFTTGTFLGNFFILINASSYALFLVLVKPLMVKYPPLVIMKWIFTFGLIYVLPVSAGLLGEPDYSHIPFTIWMSVAYIVIFTTVIAYFLNNYSLKNISPTVNSAYIYLQPFLATVVALTAGKDVLTWNEIIAAGFIFTGVYFVSFRGMEYWKNG